MLNHGYNLVVSVSVGEEFKLMARKPFTMESNLSKIQEKIKEKPQKALGIIGQNLVKEIKPNINTKGKGRNAFLKATLSSWARRKEGDLIIGFKDPKKIGFLAGVKGLEDYKWDYDDVQDPIKPAVLKNLDMIHEEMGKAMLEISKDKK